MKNLLNIPMKTMSTFERAFWSGILATGPMTLAMYALQKRLPLLQKSPIPPATLTSEALNKFGFHPNAAQKANVSLISHFGYGIACASTYAKFNHLVPGSSLVKGGAFGLAVWAGSYLGLTPALGFRASAYKMPASRNAMMIASHVVWGACLGYAEAQMRKNKYALNGKVQMPFAE